MEYKSYLILIPPAMVGLFFIISSLGIELVHYKIDKICKLRYTFIDNIYSAAGTEIETRSQLIEPVEILQIYPVSGGKMLQFPTRMKTSRPMT